jgi:hypothetical protein
MTSPILIKHNYILAFSIQIEAADKTFWAATTISLGVWCLFTLHVKLYKLKKADQSKYFRLSSYERYNKSWFLGWIITK